jgi:polyisoprenoid-binding protein YceI
VTTLLALLLTATPETAAAPAQPAAPVVAAAQVYRLGPRSGKMQFQAYSRLTDPLGSFGSWRGSVTVPGGDLSQAIIDIKVEISTIDTANDKRDNHLRTSDFFNAPKWPLASFKAKGMKSLGANRYKVAGTFTMMGVSKPVSFTAKVAVSGGKMKIKSDFSIDRTHWGMVGYMSSFSVNPIKKKVRVFFDLTAKIK